MPLPTVISVVHNLQILNPTILAYHVHWLYLFLTSWYKFLFHSYISNLNFQSPISYPSVNFPSIRTLHFLISYKLQFIICVALGLMAIPLYWNSLVKRAFNSLLLINPFLYMALYTAFIFL